MKYLVEYAKFMKVEIEAESLNEAKEKACAMDDDDIEIQGESYEPWGYIIWNDPVARN